MEEKIKVRIILETEASVKEVDENYLLEFPKRVSSFLKEGTLVQLKFKD